MTHICIGKKSQHWFGQWLVVCAVTDHCLNQCWWLWCTDRIYGFCSLITVCITTHSIVCNGQHWVSIQNDPFWGAKFNTSIHVLCMMIKFREIRVIDRSEKGSLAVLGVCKTGLWHVLFSFYQQYKAFVLYSPYKRQVHTCSSHAYLRAYTQSGSWLGEHFTKL